MMHGTTNIKYTVRISAGARVSYMNLFYCLTQLFHVNVKILRQILPRQLSCGYFQWTYCSGFIRCVVLKMLLT